MFLIQKDRYARLTRRIVERAICNLLVASGLSMALVGCSSSLTYASPGDGNFRYSDFLIPDHGYDAAFQTAVEWKFVRERTGQDFITFLTPERFVIGVRPDGSLRTPCSEDQFSKDFLQDPRVCNLATPSASIDRHNSRGCVQFRVSTTMLNNPLHRKWIVEAVEDPCRALKNPDDYPTTPQRRAQGPAPMSPAMVWRVLECGGERPVRGRLIKIDETSGVVEFQLSR